MKGVPFYKIKLNEGFWKAKQELNRDVTMNSVWDRFYDTGRTDAFACNWKEGDDEEKKPHFFWDSDVAKWIEAAAYILKTEKNPSLEERVDKLVDEIEKNQWDDGYFNIYYTITGEKRFSDRDKHELYCAGHLMEAAVAYYDATGKDKMLRCMEKYADLIYKIFYEEKSAAFETPGHEEIEIALIKMYKCTGKKKYLDLAGFFINTRGANKKDTHIYEDYEYAQSHIPVREQTEAVGHSVRALYLYTAMSDYAAETGDTELIAACMQLMDDIVKKKMYITGATGSIAMGEKFTAAYDLPNTNAYAETCASIALMLFGESMTYLTDNAYYSDAVERAMYNGMLSGLSLDGKGFFYTNPLEINLKNNERNRSYNCTDWLPITERVEIFGCSCCPPNVNRIFASIQRFAYGIKDKTVYINQFMASSFEDGGIKLSVDTNYPNNGKIIISSEGAEALMVRIPFWCNKFEVSVPYKTVNGYIYITELSDSVTVEFKMEPTLIWANPNVRENFGKAAVMYGPVVYCAEEVDNRDMFSMLLCRDLNANVTFDEAFGMNVINADAYRVRGSEELYRAEEFNSERTRIKLIPYYCFANRGESDMRVWFPIK